PGLATGIHSPVRCGGAADHGAGDRRVQLPRATARRPAAGRGHPRTGQPDLPGARRGRRTGAGGGPLSRSGPAGVAAATDRRARRRTPRRRRRGRAVVATVGARGLAGGRRPGGPGDVPVDRLMERYLERPPLPELADVVRTVWIQRTGAEPYPQHHLPTGGVEIHVPIGGRPVLLGPLTGPLVELLPPHTTIIGVRFRPGAAPALPAALDELLDQRVDLAELWRVSADRLAEAVDRSGTPERAVQVLQRLLLRERRRQDPADPLVQAAVLALMPWQRVEIDSLAERLALSPSQLRRRCQRVVGVPPKVLQRT